jgi:hypothetical protein
MPVKKAQPQFVKLKSNLNYSVKISLVASSGVARCLTIISKKIKMTDDGYGVTLVPKDDWEHVKKHIESRLNRSDLVVVSV